MIKFLEDLIVALTAASDVSALWAYCVPIIRHNISTILLCGDKWEDKLQKLYVFKISLRSLNSSPAKFKNQLY
jgi:hypothetical protein